MYKLSQCSKLFPPHSASCSKLLKCKSKTTSCLNLPCNTTRSICASKLLMKKARVPITFVKTNGAQITGIGKEGESILDVVVNNELDIPGYGACEGTLSCSTCHVIFKEEDFEKLKADHQIITDEELDMLDLAPGACSTSRLGCQITVTKNLEGLVVKVPEIVKDQRELGSTSEMEKQNEQ